MIEAKHTPGPWLQEPGDTVICIRATADHESYRIADVGGMPYWKRFTEADKSNARLIAAAPDLLAACKEFVRKVDAGEAKSTRSYAQMNAAIAKAEGTS